MRISDWSSDVCSSDLRAFAQRGGDAGYAPGQHLFEAGGGHRQRQRFVEFASIEAARATTRRGWRFDRESPAVARIARRPVLLDRPAFLAPARCGPPPGTSAQPPTRKSVE